MSNPPVSFPRTKPIIDGTDGGLAPTAATTFRAGGFNQVADGKTTSAHPRSGRGRQTLLENLLHLHLHG